MTRERSRAGLALILTSDVAPDAAPDFQGTLEQANDIEAALIHHGWRTQQMRFTPNLLTLRQQIETARPAIVVNLVEDVFGRGGLVHIVPALLEEMGIPTTGSSAAALFATTQKLTAKRLMRANAMPTPDWAEGPDWSLSDPAGRYIVKCATEDASIGIHADSVVTGRQAIIARAHRAALERPGVWYAEAYIEGREFNVSILETNAGPRILPLAEMTFTNYPPGKPRIVDYEAKWVEGTFEFENTKRRFIDETAEADLAARLRAVALQGWTCFGLGGYARIDMRVDAAGSVFAIDVNANPDLSEGIGLAAAAQEAGIAYDGLIQMVLEAAFRKEERTR